MKVGGGWVGSACPTLVVAGATERTSNSSRTSVRLAGFDFSVHTSSSWGKPSRDLEAA
jgi:hypothetical protein